MKIGVIDSGIGGLTVLKSLINNCKNHEYIYFGDTFNLPYGEKSKDEVIKFANNIIKFLESKNVDMIVIACGTLSSNIKDIKSKVRLIDIISPLKNKLDNYQKISIMATQLSIKTNAFKKYINSDLNLISCQELVPIIESNDYSKLDKCLESYLKNDESEALILGCTHYPIIKDEIKKHYTKEIICLDRYVVDIIKEMEESTYSLKLYFSKIDDTLKENVKRILELDDIEIERKCLND